MDAEEEVRSYYDKDTNLIILACRDNKVKILEYLLERNLFVSNSGNDEDERVKRNAFYYAIRSGNVELIDILINKWPDNYFAVHAEELDEILSQAYEELKLKNVPLSEEMEMFVENKLINLRFFSNASGQDQNVNADLNNIRDRIELVLQNINMLKAEYSNTKKVDEKLLFIAKFIAQNLHILKQQLKSSYRRLPWEEMEFCLVSFISSHTKQQEINLFHRATLNTSRMLNHLDNFAKKLVAEKDALDVVGIRKLADLPNLQRDKVVAEIVSDYPPFADLYSDYQHVRDVHSLEKISHYVKLALSADPKEREGQLIMTRVLQVIGEYLKNTLESPKLSSTTSDLLLLSLPKNTRKIVIDLRNSPSHAYSLAKRTEIEENVDVNFFIGVQNDTKRVDAAITDILYKNKNKMVRILLKKITSSDSLDDIKEVAEIFRIVELDKILTESLKVMENEKLEKLIKELSRNTTDKTNYEKQLFNQINNIIDFAKTKTDVRADYMTAFTSLTSLSISLKEHKIDNNNIRGMKFFANKTLENIASQIEPHNLKEIAELSLEIARSAGSRIQNLDKINRSTCEILHIAELGTGDLKWIEKLRDKLNEKGSFIPTYEQGKTYNATEQQYENQLELKLSELKSIFRDDTFNEKLVELLVLDVMSILGRSENHLENNLLFFDDSTALLTGKCLRDHLAYGNILVDVLSSDASIINSKELISENVIKRKKKFGKLVKDDPSKLKDKYDESLITIANQKQMFAALEEGNLEDLKSCLRKGADINARSMNSSTTLHFAARGPNLEVIKFLLDQKLRVLVKDANGQSPLHFAAASGRKNIVEFFVREAGAHVDDVDDSGQTPLHIAAKNGHSDVVEVLLKTDANTNAKDKAGYSPLHYAIQNNHIDAAKILLKKEENVDINESMGGFTSLHLAADGGFLELVTFLLENEANVNARTDKEAIPLHTAALNGHLEVVNALILKGADVNARVLNGCTPLHFAIENGHEQIANTLLKHGANVNTIDNTYNNTPLHYASRDGHETIVKALLKNKAIANIGTADGVTPLHFAVQGGHLKVVAALLEHGVNIRAKDSNNATSLFYASESGHTLIAELLIKHGAEINDKDNDYRTALLVAAQKCHRDIIELLIRNKAEVRAQDSKGNTPLHAATMNGSKDVVDLLLKNEAQVNARNQMGLTPLHVAAMCGNADIICFVIDSKADVNAKANYGLTPLHLAIMGVHKDTVNLLIKNKAKVHAEGKAGISPLHVAVEAGQKDIVEILLANGANVNAKSGGTPPLLSAIKHNREEIVELLIEKGADVNHEGGKPLLLAVTAGYKGIVEILLNNEAFINMKNGATLLHLAASNGHKEIVNALIRRGANVDAMTTSHCQFANVNLASYEGAPIHVAAGQGYYNVVQVLLNNGANVNAKDHKSRTPLVLAVAGGHLEVVKTLLQCEKVNINAKGYDGWTVLHIAAQLRNLEMVKYLVYKGSTINAKDAAGSMPIHIAAIAGYTGAVEFFLSMGASINALGQANQTLLHYAAMQDVLKVVKYLITLGADVNAIDSDGFTPLHIAAQFGYKAVVEVLLKNGAICDTVYPVRPIQMTNNKDVFMLLESTEKLFESVKRNSSSDVEDAIKAGAVVDAKNVDGGTSLHYAAWKGNFEVVKILLQNNANPNAVCSKGYTPVHFATMHSHLKVVKALLSHGAAYDALSDSGETPSDFAVHEDITCLFKLISESFKKVEEDNARVIDDLNQIQDIDTVKAVMGACNRENGTLVIAAVQSNFSKVEQLKQIWQGDVSAQINAASAFFNQGNYQKALSILRNAFEKRKEIIGPDNPGTLDIQTYIAQVLCMLGSYQEALNMFEDIFQKQKKMLGLNCLAILNTRSMIAFVLHKQGKNKEAFNIYKAVYHKQVELQGSCHLETLDTLLHMALMLDEQGKHEEALNINMDVFERMKKTLGTNACATESTQNNLAMVLANQGKYEEALKMYKEVFEKNMMILGMSHVNTLRALRNIAGVFFNQNKFHASLKIFQEVLDIQKEALRPNHPHTLNTQYNIGNILFAQGKWISALEAYRETFDQIKAVFGTSHPSLLVVLAKMEMTYLRFKREGSEASAE